MGLPAAKHLDVVMGIDTHIILIPSPAGPVPTPIPHPYIGILFDPMDYVPMMGATVKVNGVPRAVAGTSGQALPPHIPMGGPFAKPPTNESEMFMGSKTVHADGDPMSFAGLPVLSCQDIGMPAPPRPKKKSAAKSLMLPVSTVLPIPTGPMVLVGGPPTIQDIGVLDVIGPLAKGLGKARKALAKRSKKFARKMKSLSKKLHNAAGAVMDKLKINKKSVLRNKVHRGICAVTGHPVDITTGKLFTDFVDLEFQGPLPFKLERVWYSTSTYEGPLGHGWHHSLDMALSADEKVVGIRLADGRAALFPPLQAGGTHFDAGERLTLRRDAYGYALTDAQGLTYRFAELRGRAVQPLGSIQDRSGFAIQFGYDARGRLEQVKDSAGCLWLFRYDASEHLSSIEGPHPTQTDKRVVHLSYVYDGRGNLAEVEDALGGRQRFQYERQLLVRETNKNGLSFYFAWDGKDDDARCVRTWGDGGIYDHKLTYQPGLTVVENSLGYKTSYLHDGAMVNKTVDAYGNTAQTEYDEGYRVGAEIDELGQRTAFQYDERGNLIERMGPDGAKTSFAYGPHDLPVHAVDALGGEWSWSYDTLGRVTERKDPLGRVMRFHHHAQWLVGVTDPAGGYTALGYDARGNLDAVATPDNAITRYAHDLLGRVTAVTDPKGNVQGRELDLLGRVTSVQEPDGNVRSLLYDREGNVLHAKDVQHDVRFTYAGMNQLASRSEVGTTVKFEYDTEEQLVGIINEHGHVYRFEFGPTGEVDEEHGFDGLMRRYTRDRAGRVTHVERPGSRFSSFKYDPAGRVISVTHFDQSIERFAYRPDGELTHASNSEAALVFERDALGRILKESQGEHWVASEYDLLGLRARMRSSLGAELELARNVMGDVTELREKSGFQARFERDLLGLELERSLPGGVKSRWERDKLGRPVQHNVSSERGTLRAVGYQWEPNDRLRKVIDALEGPTEYRHDALGNLAWGRYADGKGEMRMPDAVGNLFKREDRKDRVYGPAGQLLVQSTARGEIHYVYDPEGNLVEKREPDGRSWRYAWNGSGMLAKVTRPDGTEVTFGYDPLGRRVRKTYRGQTTKWVWDGNVPLHEWVEGALETLPEPEVPYLWNADPLIKKREAELAELLNQGPPERGTKQSPITWLFEAESFAPLAKLLCGRHFSIVTDHLGAPVLMVDGQGEAVWSAQYSVYGELRSLTGTRDACPFRWPGQYEDLETGLYYNRFRYYDAEAGHYTSQDPIRLAGGDKVYAYPSDPLIWIDPTGLAACGRHAARDLPPLKGKSVAEIENTLQRRGFTRTNPNNLRNQRWVHPDGSEVQVHKYGNVAAGPYKSGNNAHVHKSIGRHSEPGTVELNDRGLPSTNPAETHIGIRNPRDYPTMAGRPHGS